MKSGLVFLGLFVLPVCLAQKIKWRPIEVKSDSTYEIKNEGKSYKALFDLPEDHGLKRSSLIVNNDTLRNIMFTEAKLTGDTLKILIHQTDEAYHHAYRITVVHDRFYIQYSFLTSGVQTRRTIKPLMTKLVLSSLEFRKGSMIRGYTAYKGKCIQGCWEDLIFIEGNFSAIIE